jgi:hypothetical protein
MHKTAMALSAALLTGCQAATSYQPQPTLTLSCEAACTASYTDPRDQARPTNQYDAAIAITGQLMSIAPVFGLTYLGTRGLKALQGSGGIITDNSVVNRGRIGSSDDYTHAPTIVTQPAPAILTQPAPLIVTQPAPVIVDPVTVFPVVVTP